LTESLRSAALDSLALDLKNLSDDAASASVFLPRYDQRQCSITVSKLEEDLKSKRAEVLPKKKFAFGSRSKAPTPGSALPAVSDAAASAVSAAAVTAAAAAAAAAVCGTPESGTTIDGLRGGCVVRADVAGRDLTITDCQDATIHVPVPVPALFVRGVRGCVILVGPISGAAHVDACDGSTLALACHQVGESLFVSVCLVMCK
jgi:hypothetical protein